MFGDVSAAIAHGSEESEGEERRGGADDGDEAAEFPVGGDLPELAAVALAGELLAAGGVGVADAPSGGVVLEDGI